MQKQDGMDRVVKTEMTKEQDVALQIIITVRWSIRVFSRLKWCGISLPGDRIELPRNLCLAFMRPGHYQDYISDTEVKTIWALEGADMKSKFEQICQTVRDRQSTSGMLEAPWAEHGVLAIGIQSLSQLKLSHFGTTQEEEEEDRSLCPKKNVPDKVSEMVYIQEEFECEVSDAALAAANSFLGLSVPTGCSSEPQNIFWSSQMIAPENGWRRMRTPLRLQEYLPEGIRHGASALCNIHAKWSHSVEGEVGMDLCLVCRQKPMTKEVLRAVRAFFKRSALVDVLYSSNAIARCKTKVFIDSDNGFLPERSDFWYVTHRILNDSGLRYREISNEKAWARFETRIHNPPERSGKLDGVLDPG